LPQVPLSAIPASGPEDGGIVYWNTADHPVEDQLSYWADVVCEAFTPLSPARTRRHLAHSRQADGLSGWVRSASLTSTNCAEIASCTQRLSHGNTEVRRSPDEVVFVNLQLTGSCRGQQDGRRCRVTPGSFALFDTTRPYQLEFEESEDGEPWRVLSFRVPREQLTCLMPGNEAFTGVTIDGRSGPGLVAATMMASLWASRHDLSVPSRRALDHAYSQVVATALGAFEQPDGVGRAGVDAALRATVARFVAERLTLGAVRVEDAAAHVGVSVRKLHQLYSGTGTTFATHVREMRLRGVARELADPTVNPPITEIATRWGFCDGGHLSREFRRHHDCTPTEYRAQRRHEPGRAR
jgi:AraC-like DNA-binding protein